MNWLSKNTNINDEPMSVMSFKSYLILLPLIMFVSTAFWSCENIRPAEEVCNQVLKEIEQRNPNMSNIEVTLKYAGKDPSEVYNLYEGLLTASISEIGDISCKLEVTDNDGNIEWNLIKSEETVAKINAYNERERIKAELQAFNNKWGGKWICHDNDYSLDIERTYTFVMNPDGTCSEEGVYRHLNDGKVFSRTYEGNWNYIHADVVSFYMEAREYYKGYFVRKHIKEGFFRSDGSCSPEQDFSRVPYKYRR